MKPNALTLVLNANARKPRLAPPSGAELERLRGLLGPNSKVHLTHTLEELERLLGEWNSATDGAASNATISFYGGDGSVACGLTLLIRSRGEDADLPPILALRAGTINMLCSVLGFRESPERTLRRWLASELDTLREIPSLKVEVEGRPPLYGFVFSWGVGYRVLGDYYSRGPDVNVVDGLAVLAKTFLSACRPNARATALFRSHDLKLELDGAPVALEPAYSLVVGTIDRLSLGLKPFPPGPIMPGTFHVSANAMPVAAVAWRSPTLLYRWGDQRKIAKKSENKLLAATGARQLETELVEGFTMDGEVYELAGPTRVRISSGPLVQFWTAHDRH